MRDDRIDRYSRLLADAELERDQWKELAGLRFGDGVADMLAEHMEWRTILIGLHTGLHRCIVDGVASDYIVCTTARALGLMNRADR